MKHSTGKLEDKEEFSSIRNGLILSKYAEERLAYACHIKANCKSMEVGTPCIKGDQCTMGHDFPELRLSLFRWRRKQAVRNWIWNGGQISAQYGRKVPHLPWKRDGGRDFDLKTQTWNDFKD